MRQHPIPLLLCFIFLAPPLQAAVPTDDENWTVRKDEDGVRIATRSMDDSSFDAFRAETELDSPMASLLAVMGEPESCLRWVHTCIEARALGNGDFHHRYAYSVNALPWPASNRDYVVRITTEGDQQEVIITMEAVSGMEPEQRGLVRIEHSFSIYRITPLDDERTAIAWFQHTEPGGSLPGWLVNRMTTDLPYRSLLNLRDEVQKTRYRNYRIQYDDNGQITGLERDAEDD
ncbi:MAG: lipid-binding protein [Halomonadaceae bacterium]|nr:MAG: lipid-binding protein [Halomonadaceae bacterium]